MAEQVKKSEKAETPDPSHDEELDQAAEAKVREVMDRYVNELAELETARRESDAEALEADLAEVDADPQAEAKRQRELHRLAEQLRGSEDPRKREEARELIQELGEVPGDFVLRLTDGSLHRVEVVSTHHNGLKVVDVHEDPQ